MAFSCASVGVSAPCNAVLTGQVAVSSRITSTHQRIVCPWMQGSPLCLRAPSGGRQGGQSGFARCQAKCSLPAGSGDARGGAPRTNHVEDNKGSESLFHIGRVGTAFAALSLSLLQAFAPIPLGDVSGQPGGTWGVGPQPAEAVLYSPDTAGKLPKTGEAALRRSIPAITPTMKTIQSSLEEIFFLLRIPQRKPYGTMESNVKKVVQLATTNKAAILAAVPAVQAERAGQVYTQMLEGKGSLEGLLAAIQLQDPDKVASRLAATLDTVADLMTLQAPGLPYPVSTQFNDLPRLTGRATVEFTISRNNGASFTVAGGGGPQEEGVLQIVLDGYSAPLTAGNFAALLQKGAYTGLALKAGPQAILGEGPPGAGTEVPLEVMPSGEVAPIYRTPLDVQDGEIPVLPMSVYGAVAMSHAVGSDSYSHPSQFFVYLYDRRNSGLGGLSFEEGQFAVFGYVTKGRDILPQLKTGDVIKSAKLISGEDRLVIPTK